MLSNTSKLYPRSLDQTNISKVNETMQLL